MTPAELKAARRRLGLTQRALGEALGVSRVTIARWEAGLHPLPRAVGLLLNRMLKDSPPQRP